MGDADDQAHHPQSHYAAILRSRKREHAQQGRAEQVIKRRLEHLPSLVRPGQGMMFLDIPDVSDVTIYIIPHQVR